MVFQRLFSRQAFITIITLVDPAVGVSNPGRFQAMLVQLVSVQVIETCTLLAAHFTCVHAVFRQVWVCFLVEFFTRSTSSYRVASGKVCVQLFKTVVVTLTDLTQDVA